MPLFFFLIGIFSMCLVLFFISEKVTKQTFMVIYLMTKSRTLGITCITLLLFPGIVLHELSHLFTAEILGVRTGKLTLVPESIEENTIQSGSVEVAQTDPVRSAIIGLAPFFTGIIALLALTYSFGTVGEKLLQEWQYSQALLFGAILYCIVTISNTMFSSSQDLKGVLPLFVVLTILSAGAYALGFRIGFTEDLYSRMLWFLTSLAQSIGIVLIINLFTLLITTFLMRIVKKTLHVR